MTITNLCLGLVAYAGCAFGFAAGVWVEGYESQKMGPLELVAVGLLWPMFFWWVVYERVARWATNKVLRWAAKEQAKRVCARDTLS